MAKKPPSATKKQATRQRTWKDWLVITVYILLAVALVVPLVASLFGAY